MRAAHRSSSATSVWRHRMPSRMPSFPPVFWHVPGQPDSSGWSHVIGFSKNGDPERGGPASGHQQAAGHVADLPGDEARLVRSEVKNEIRDLVGPAEPAHRRLVYPALIGALADGLHHGGLYTPRPDRVDPDTVRSKLASQMPGEADQRSLGRRVM